MSTLAINSHTECKLSVRHYNSNRSYIITLIIDGAESHDLKYLFHQQHREITGSPVWRRRVRGCWYPGHRVLFLRELV